jgi:dihydrolipoamide dehydrogenase
LDGHVAATNAVGAAMMTRDESVIPMGGFTDPEYAHVGITEAEARQRYEITLGVVRFDETARTMIDGRTTGFCKLIADRNTKRILGCHVVGERAADIVQAVAIAIRGGLGVDELARMSLAFPTHVGIVSRAAYRAAKAIDPGFVSSAQVEGS